MVVQSAYRRGQRRSSSRSDRRTSQQFPRRWDGPNRFSICCPPRAPLPPRLPCTLVEVGRWWFRDIFFAGRSIFRRFGTCWQPNLSSLVSHLRRRELLPLRIVIFRYPYPELFAMWRTLKRSKINSCLSFTNNFHTYLCQRNNCEQNQQAFHIGGFSFRVQLRNEWKRAAI